MSAVANYDTFVEKFEGVKIKDLQGKEVTSGKIGTGFTATYKDKTYNVTKKGDASGDGDVNIIDVSQIIDHILEEKILDKKFQGGADCSGDTNINIIDLVKVIDYILEEDTLNV